MEEHKEPLHLYALAMVAHKVIDGRVDIAAAPTWARASSAREAEEMGLAMWRRRMPQEGGWRDHTCRSVIIPDEAIIPDVIPRVRITIAVPDTQGQ